MRRKCIFGTLLGELTALPRPVAGGSLRHCRPLASNFCPLGLISALQDKIPGYATVLRHFQCRGQECLNHKFFHCYIHLWFAQNWLKFGDYPRFFILLKNLRCFFLWNVLCWIITANMSCCRFFCIFNIPMSLHTDSCLGLPHVWIPPWSSLEYPTLQQYDLNLSTHSDAIGWSVPKETRMWY